MRFLFRAGALMLNITLKTVQMTELNRYSPIRARTEEYKCADQTFSDLVAGRQKPATVRHRASGAANAAANGCGERAPPPARHSCRGMAVAGGGCGDQLARPLRCAADGRGRYVRRVDRDPAAFAPARAHRSATRSATQGHGHMGVQPCKEKRAHMLCDNVSMFESPSSLTVDHSIK